MKKYDPNKSLIADKVAKEFMVSKAYVYMCINGEPKTANRDDIRKRFKELYTELEEKVKETLS